MPVPPNTVPCGKASWYQVPAVGPAAVYRAGIRAADGGFDIARLRVARIAGKPAARLDRLDAAGEDRDTMVRTLPAPNRVVPGRLKRGMGKGGVAALDFLQTDHVGTRRSEPFEQVPEALVDAVDVEGRDLH